MGKPHKHAELIKAWADGARIEVRGRCQGRDTWHEVTDSPLWNDSQVYRIKPEPKPDIYYYYNIYDDGIGKAYKEVDQALIIGSKASRGIIKTTMCGETNKLKSVEIIK